MGLGDLLSDLAGRHPGRALERIPGGKFVETTLGKTAWDFINILTNAPAGLVYTATQAPRHPIRYLEQTAEDVWETWQHPLRHPGYTLLNTVGLVPLPIGVAARGLGGVTAATRAMGAGVEATRAGTAARLALAVERGELPEALGSAEAAAAAGRSGEFARMVDPETGLFVPKGKAVRNALLLGPARQERLLWPKGIEAMDDMEGLATHGWWYSRDPTIRAAQKLVDRAYNAAPDSMIAPIWKVVTEKGPLRTQAQRISTAEKAWQQGQNKQAKQRGIALLGKHAELLTPVPLMVLRLIGEGTDPAKLLAYHQRMLDSGTLKGRTIAETAERMDVIREAAQYVQPKTFTTKKLDGTEREWSVNELRPEHQEALGEFIEDFRGLSNERTKASRMVGVLGEASAHSRAAGPFALVETGEVLPNIKRLKRRLGQIENYKGKEAEAEALRRRIERYETGQISLDDMVDASEEGVVKELFDSPEELASFVDQSGVFRIPYALPKFGFGYFSKEARRSRKTYSGSRKPNVPGSYTNPFTGAILKMGGGEQNTARLIAESYTEAHRFIALREIWDRIQRVAQATPEGIPEEYQQLVYLDRPGSKLTKSQVGRVLTQKGDIGARDSIMAGRLYEGIRKFIFPDRKASADDLGITPEERAGIMGDNQPFQDATPYGWGWVDRRMLGDLYKKNPLIGVYESYPLAEKAIRATDAINQGMKSAMLFLRPAYAFPNFLGNLALNMIQDGMLSPIHMGMNAKLWLSLDKARREAILVQMGESSTEARYVQGVSSKGRVTRGIHTGSEWMANFYSRFVDKPFRANSWIQEARRQGYETPSQINKLLDDPDLQSQRQAITVAATDEIINFERMGPGEEAYLRRLIFFYPFTKGASRYTLNFPKEHPFANAASSVLGQQGFERTEEVLGPLPVWAEGLIPLEGLGIPLTGSGEDMVANPAAFSIMGEPAHLAAQALNLIAAHPNPDYALSTNLPPVEQGLLAFLTGGQANRFAAPGAPIAGIAEQETFGGIPLIALINTIMGRAAIGAPLEMSVYPDPNIWHALNRFAGMGGLSPRLADPELLNYRRWQEQPLTYVEH